MGTRIKSSEVIKQINSSPNGYLQIFNWRCSLLKDRLPRVMCENFCSAGGVDSWFLQQFPKEKQVVIPELAVTHITHGEYGQLWNGARREGCWRQLGYIGPDGHFTAIEEPVGSLKGLKLTETLHGETVEIESNYYKVMEEYVKVKDDGLIFNGRPIGRHHIHVAYRS